ncbi:hypothetical protein SAMN05660826_01418 [Caldanaerovirga acetigignens]|uniref:DUF5317 domain-containing protein n=1 Tax=Caldanaerovirga acetigignens TaxID=447595 RepID=A0A1M7K1H9_9FIRM|nr:DUF5317 domain-containing protein [Caldanaerovirga acetigignens]SHM58657.1 hypothetical protein SAMN05660826_01418 [Caldanaerovirga acetigignens]
MLLVDFVLLSIIVGLLRKGSLKKIGEIPIRKLELIFLSLIIRYLPLFLKGSLKEYVVQYILVVSFISYGLLLYSLLSNWHLKPLRIVTLGVLLNFLAIIANGGKMPVSLLAVDFAGLGDFKQDLFNPLYPYHVAMMPKTRFKIFGDIFPLPKPYPNPKVFSLGDVLMGIGVFSLIQEAMLKKKSASDKISRRKLKRNL